MSNSLLTVVVPVYNTGKYLNRCIESILNQTINNISIVIINDGSTDNSEKIIEKNFLKNPNIEYIKLEQNIGVGNARNLGIEKAETKYVTFIDSDDWVDSSYYENMLQIIEYDQSDVCISGIKTEADDVYNWKFRYKYPSNFTMDGNFCIHLLTKQYNHDITISPIVNNKIYKKALISNNNILFNQSRRAQDLYFSFMIFIYTNRVSICHDVFYHYYQRNFSATHNFTKQYIDDYFYILYTLKQELNVRHLFENYEKEYESYVNHYMTKLINNMFNNIQIADEQKRYIIYILKKATELISIDKLIKYIDIERLKLFWEIRN